MSYLIAQFAGALIGAMSIFGFFYMSYQSESAMISQRMGDAANRIIMYEELGYKAGNTFGGLLGEIVLTFIFIYIFLNAGEPGAPHKLIDGIIVGAGLSLVTFVGVGLTNACFNPARGLAVAISEIAYFDTHESIELIWIWLLGPAIGAVAAPFFYRFLHGREVVSVIAPVKVGGV